MSAIEKPYFKTNYLDFEVTEANEKDAKEIFEVVNEAYKRDFFRYPERSRASFEKIHGYFSDRAHSWYVIKVKKDNITEIACAALYSTDAAAETKTEGNVHMLSARPAYWGMKLSSFLLRKMEERALQEKKSKIRLIVANTNPGLMRVYEKHGYRMTGEKFLIPEFAIHPKFQYKNPDGTFTIFCWHMEKDLKIKCHL